MSSCFLERRVGDSQRSVRDSRTHTGKGRTRDRKESRPNAASGHNRSSVHSHNKFLLVSVRRQLELLYGKGRDNFYTFCSPLFRIPPWTALEQDLLRGERVVNSRHGLLRDRIHCGEEKFVSCLIYFRGFEKKICRSLS